MAAHDVPDPAEMDFAERVATTLGTLDAMTAPPAKRAVGFSELYAYATNPGIEPSVALTTALSTDEILRANLRRILANTAIGRLPQVAAASSGAIDSREGDGCRIEIKPSRANAGQIYILITLAENWARTPTALFVYSPEGRGTKVALPDSQDGKIQLLVESDSEVARALRDIATEVYLS